MPPVARPVMMAEVLSPEDALARRKRRWREKRIRAQGVMQGVVSMLRPGDVVFDCGANVGEVSAQLAATGATVHAFEPDPLAFEALSARLGDADNVHLHAVCVGAKAGQVQLSRAENFEGDPQKRTTRSSVVQGGNGMNDVAAIPVKMIDLPAMIEHTAAEHGDIAFLKMDIEGAELDLLEAMESRDLFADIRMTVVETHQGKFPELRPRFKDLRARFAAKYPTTKVFLDWI